MVYCPKCGKKNEEDAEYCSKCGTNLISTKKKYKKTQTKTPAFEKQVEDFAEEVGQLGKKAGKTIGQGMKNFGEEVGDIGKRVGKEIEKTSKEIESWYDRTFGIFWPFIVSLVGIVILWLVIEIMRIMSDENPVFGKLSDFLLAYLWLFFGLMLFFSYTAYTSRKYKPFRWVSPIISAIGIVIIIWIVMEIFKILDFLGIPFFETSALMIERILPLIFVLVLVVGYLVLMLTVTVKQTLQSYEERVAQDDSKPSESSSAESGEYRRLYRSGKNRILGGVCGGIAEYFKIDPVLIRMLWIIIVFFPPGLGILLYFIFWIVVPRNPNHSWH